MTLFLVGNSLPLSGGGAVMNLGDPAADCDDVSDDLPHAPLELMHPLRLPGAEIPGLRILTEIGGSDGMLLWRLHRAVLRWSVRPADSDLGGDARVELDRLEFALLQVKSPLGAAGGLLAGYMRDAEEARPKDVSWACLCLSEYAYDRGATQTALEFVQAAAFAWPRHARFAWLVGCMFRAAMKPDVAAVWFRRAYRVAVWTRDAEAQVQCLRGLVSLPECPVGLTRTLNARALRVARSHGLSSLEAEIRAETSPRTGSRTPASRRLQAV